MTSINAERIDNRLLDETYAVIDAHEDFVGSLMTHQRTTVRGLIDLEDSRAYDDIASSAIAFADALGSGKTISLINLMLHRPIPRAKMHVASYGSSSAYTNASITTAHLGKSLLRPNVVVVGSSVLIQWEKEIARFTGSKLKVLSISDYYGIIRFRNCVADSSINSFDVVLVKNGSVHWNEKLLPVVSVIGDIIGNKVFARVIYDDADTIQMTNDTFAIPTLSTVIVTGTRNTDSPCPNPEHKNHQDALTYGERFRLPAIIFDDKLFEVFRVRCSDAYVKSSTSMPIVEFYKYVYQNPDDKLLDLMATMGDHTVDSLVEMINGDAIKTAAAAMDIVTSSVADIFQKLIGDRYDNYTKATKKLEIVNALIEENAGLEYDVDDKGKTHDLSQDAIDEIVKDINKCVKSELDYRSDKLAPVLAELSKKIETDKKEAGVILDRVMENIREGFCQVCAVELGSVDVFIMKCCNIILCDECAFKGNHVHRQTDYATKKLVLCGKCASCMRPVYPHKDFIFVDKEFDISRLENCEVTDDTEIGGAAILVPDSTPEPEKVHDNPKLNALYHICKGVAPAKRTHVPNYFVRNLIIGSRNVPETGPVKVAIAAGFKESVEKIYEFLTEKGITWVELAGTALQKHEIVESYRREDGPQVLIVNSSETCAGLNLTMITDLVFYNVQGNRSVEEQFSARIMRIGKKTNPRIHFLTYTNEKLH